MPATDATNKGEVLTIEIWSLPINCCTTDYSDAFKFLNIPHLIPSQYFVKRKSLKTQNFLSLWWQVQRVKNDYLHSTIAFKAIRWCNFYILLDCIACYIPDYSLDHHSLLHLNSSCCHLWSQYCLLHFQKYFCLAQGLHPLSLASLDSENKIFYNLLAADDKSEFPRDRSIWKYFFLI